jgi:hypothetical protein
MPVNNAVIREWNTLGLTYSLLQCVEQYNQVGLVGLPLPNIVMHP